MLGPAIASVPGATAIFDANCLTGHALPSRLGSHENGGSQANRTHPAKLELDLRPIKSLWMIGNATSAGL